MSGRARAAGCARRGVARLGLVCLLAPAAALDAQGRVPQGAGRTVLLHECRSALGRREVTLFADGTVRLRQGPAGKERMALAELDRRELEGYLTRLAALAGADLAEAAGEPSGPGGDWVERCRLELRLPERPVVRLAFGGLEALPLPLARLARLAEELAGEVDPHDPLGAAGLPEGYEARVGDVLRRRDGELFEVVGFTVDGGGVELQGVDQPLTLYAPRGALDGEFVALVRRRQR